MHELSLAGNVLTIVEQAARAQAFTVVRSLHLSIPRLAAVEVQALRFALESIMAETVLDGADIVIERPTSRARCLDCGDEIRVSCHDEGCPLCGSDCWQALREQEIRVVDLLVQ